MIVSQDNGSYGLPRGGADASAGGRTEDHHAHLHANDPDAAVQAVRNGRFKAALVIPAGFSREITEGRIGELGLFTDNVDSVSTAALEGVIGQATAAIRSGYVTAREPKLNEIVLRPSDLFVTVDYDRSLIPGVIVMALFMGSMTSGVFNWIMDRFSGVTEAYLVTPLSVWNIAGGILASSVLATTCEAIVVLIIGLVITGGGIAGGLKSLGALCGVIAADRNRLAGDDVRHL